MFLFLFSVWILFASCLIVDMFNDNVNDLLNMRVRRGSGLAVMGARAIRISRAL